MKLENLKNALIFLERATATGKECLAWVQTYADIQQEIDGMNAKTTAPVPTP